MRNHLILALLAAASVTAFSQDSSSPVILHAGETRMTIFKEGFRFGFAQGGTQLAAPHAQSGLLVDGAPLKQVTAKACSEADCMFSATTSGGVPVSVRVKLT